MEFRNDLNDVLSLFRSLPTHPHPHPAPLLYLQVVYSCQKHTLPPTHG